MPALADRPDDSTDSGKILGNILSLGSAEVVARGVAFIGTTYLARQLGPSGFGIVSFAVAVCAYLSLAVISGFDDRGMREVARHPDRAAAIAAGATIVRLLVASAALIITAILASLLGKPPIVKLMVVLTGLSFFSLALDTAWVHKGLERNRRVGFAVVLGQLLYVGTVVLVVRQPDHIMRVPLAQFFGALGAAAVLLLPLLRTEGLRPDIREGFKILRGSVSLTLTRLFRTIVYTFDIILLSVILGESGVGIYSAGYRVCLMIMAVGAAMQISYLPSIARASLRGTVQVEALARRSLELTSAVMVPIVVGGALTAGPLLHLLFGAEYVDGAAAFRLILLGTGFVALYGTVRNVLLTHDRTGIEAWIMAVGAAINVGLNLILIPRYGLVGAASANALAYGLILVLGFHVVHSLGIRLAVLAGSARSVMAAGVMATALIMLGPGRGIVLHIGTGIAVYFAALVAVRGIPPDAQPLWARLAALANATRDRSGTRRGP